MGGVMTDVPSGHTAVRAMHVYLNDHLAGATVGSDLAAQIRDRNHGTSLGALMGSLAPEIEEDRQILLDVMRRVDAATNPVKRAGAWLTAKVSRVKFWGPTGS